VKKLSLKFEEIKKITVIGSGTMGHGIAQLAAMAGYTVSMLDVSEDILKNAMGKISWSLGKFYEKKVIQEKPEDVLKRIHPTTNFAEAAENVDFVIEAVPEDIELKKKVFNEMDKLAPQKAILATNTSTLPITEIAKATKREEKVIGMHFSNPPQLMPLVEVIKGEKTSDETLDITVKLSRKFGKEPVIVYKDVPGFIGNRLNARVFNEAAWIVYNGEASIAEVDATARYLLGFPMGLFELSDFIGLDVGALASKALLERGFNMHPCPLSREKFEKGELGVKSSKGYYTYPGPGKYVKPEIPKELAGKVDPVRIIAPAINEAAWLIRNGIASKEDIDKGMKLGMGYPKGPLEMADEYGIDKIVEVLEKRKAETGWDEYEPDPLLREMVKKGELGKKTGKGFYEYKK